MTSAFQFTAFQEDAFQLDASNLQELLDRIAELEKQLREARAAGGGPDPIEMWDPRPERIARNNRIVMALVGSVVSGRPFVGGP